MIDILLSLALAASAVSAPTDTPAYDFSADYDIISSSTGEKIWTYTNSVKGPDDGVYSLNGRIEFAVKTLGVFQRRYSSIDSVLYDANGIVHYEIEEIDNGKRTQVTGSRSEDGTHLVVEGAQATSMSIPRTSYDLSQYAFRFPLPCSQQSAREIRILAPRTGNIETVRGEPSPVEALPDNAGCILLTRNAEGRTIKVSSFLPNGILATETSPDYQLKLTGMQYGRE